MTVFDLVASLSLDTSKFDSKLNDSSRSLSGFGAKIKSGLGTVTKVAAAALTTIGAVAAGVTSKFADSIQKTAEYGDSIDKMSQKVGLSAEAYQEWDYILKINGTSMDRCAVGVKTLTAQVEKAKNGSADATGTFKKLGISVEDLKNMSREDIFAAAIKGLQGMEEGSERAAIANTLLGRSGMELGPLLNSNADETERLREEAHKYGLVISDEAVKNSAKFTDALTLLRGAISGAKYGIMAEFLPGITTVMEGITMIFGGNGTESGVAKISEGIETFTQKLTAVIPQVLNAGKEIVLAVVRGLTSNIENVARTAVIIASELINGFVSAIPDLVKVVVSALPDLLRGLVSIFNGIVDALPQLFEIIASSLPTLIPQFIGAITGMVVYLASNFDKIIAPLIDALPDIIITITEALVSNTPKLVTGLIAFVLSIVNALPEIIKGLLEALPTIIEMVIDTVLGNLPLLIDGMIQLVFGLVDALPQIIFALLEAIPDIIVKVVEALIENLPTLIKGIVAIHLRLLEEIWKLLEVTFSSIGDWFGGLWESVQNIFSDAGEWFGNLFDSAWEAIQNAWNAVGEWFSGLFNEITGIFAGIGDWFGNIFKKAVGGIKKAFDGVKQWFANLWDGIVSVIKTPINWIIDAINVIIRGLNHLSINIPDWVPFVGGQTWGFNIGEIPHLAKGGLAYGPQLAIIGDNFNARTNPEVIAPLSELKKIFDVRQAPNVVVNINNPVVREEQDIKKIATAVSESLADCILRSGMSWEGAYA